MGKTPLFRALSRLLRSEMQKRRATTGAAPSVPVTRDEALANRRAFLRWSSAALATAAVPSTLAGCGDDSTETPVEEKVAVIGAGIAGLHCAYRLHQAGVAVTLYEALDRVGGRMFTGRGVFPEDTNQYCELGGELIDTNHATLFALAEEFAIELDDRFSPEFEPEGISREIYFVNGAVVPEETIVTQFGQVAGLMADAYEAAETDDAAFEELDNTSLTDWLVANVPPATYPELHAILQTAYRGEFGLENDEQSILNLIYLIGFDTPDEFRIFGDSDERWHTHLGNDTYTTALGNALGSERIALEHKLLRASGSAGAYELEFETPDGNVTVQATRIVFAVPFSVLRSIDTSGLGLSAEKQQVIDEIGYGTNAKVMLGFTSKVWRETHSTSGSMTTDLPVQQTWETTIGQDGAHGILTNFLGGDQGVASGSGTAADWADGVLPNLETIWPGMTDAFTGTAVRMHWPTVPTALGSYTCYKPGQWAFYGLEGTREGNVHFCGEHTSLDFQGWMEGAAESGGLVAAEILEEVGAAAPQALVAALGPKLLVPQSTYRARELGRMNPFRRKRLVREKIAEIAAEVRALRAREEGRAE
jgi:monoamine oxidase